MIARLTVILLVATGATAQLLAADWSRYINPQFGAAVDIPVGFVPDGSAQLVAGAGAQYRSSDGRATITIWGAPMQRNDFWSESNALIEADQAQGWSLTERSVTPDWAAWGGARSGMVVYTRSVATCEDRQTANVRLVYPALDIVHFDAIANRLGASLGQDGPCI